MSPANVIRQLTYRIESGRGSRSRAAGAGRRMHGTQSESRHLIAFTRRQNTNGTGWGA